MFVNGVTHDSLEPTLRFLMGSLAQNSYQMDFDY